MSQHNLYILHYHTNILIRNPEVVKIAIVRINNDRLNDLKEVINAVDKLKGVLEKYAPFITKAIELGLIEEIMLDESDDSPQYPETQNVDASQVFNETHDTFAFPPDEAQYTSLTPMTNHHAEIRVFNEKDGAKQHIEWWAAGKKTAEVYLNVWELFVAMRGMTDEHGKLIFSRFWKQLKWINAINTNHASLIFNFVGMDERFECYIKKQTDTMPTGIEVTDHALIFDTLSPTYPTKTTPEEIRKYWDDLLG